MIHQKEDESVKKKTVVLISIISLILFSFFMMYLWDRLLSDIFPWTKTNFSDYQKYTELLDKHHFHASYRFIDEIPEGAIDVKYYVHQRFREKYAAHSVVLPEKQYYNSINSRIESYCERCSEAAKLVYVMNEGIAIDIKALGEMGVEVAFLENVMQKPAQQGYYCIVVVCVNTTHGTCYTGVVVNDTTHEVIEFSVELPDEEKG